MKGELSGSTGFRSSSTMWAAAAVGVVCALGLAWAVLASPFSGPVNGPQPVRVAMVGLPVTAGAGGQSSAGCWASVGNASECFLLLVVAPTDASTSAITAFFMETSNGSTVDIPATLATSCTSVTSANGSLSSAICTEAIAHFTTTGGWVECTISLCGGSDTTSVASPPVSLDNGSAFIVQVALPSTSGSQIGIVVDGATFLFAI